MTTSSPLVESVRSSPSRLTSLVVPRVDAAREAGKLLENLPAFWEQANLGERRSILLALLDSVYVDSIEEKSIVAIMPKPAFLPLFQVATTREGSDVVLITENEMPPGPTDGPEATDPCLWWRRGRVELPVQKRPSRNVLQAYPALYSCFSELPPAEARSAQPISLILPLSALEQLHPGFMAPASPPPGLVGADVAASLGS